MPKQTEYAVFRHGANASNQSSDAVLVAVVEAASAEEACATEQPERRTVHDSAWLKLDPSVTVWANQRLTAKPASRVGKAELNDFYEREANDLANRRYAEALEADPVVTISLRAPRSLVNRIDRAAEKGQRKRTETLVLLLEAGLKAAGLGESKP